MTENVVTARSYIEKWSSVKNDADKIYAELFRLIQAAERQGEGDDELLEWLIEELEGLVNEAQQWTFFGGENPPTSGTFTLRLTTMIS
jgi:hypothetical protein